MKEPFKTIYLQWIGADRDELTESDLAEGAAEVTWCQDKIHDTDLEYRLVERKKCDCEGIGCEQCRPREAHAPATPATPDVIDALERLVGICQYVSTTDLSVTWQQWTSRLENARNALATARVAEAAPTTTDEEEIKPHSSQIYTDLRVRCQHCQGFQIWRYLEDEDILETFHRCGDSDVAGQGRKP